MEVKANLMNSPYYFDIVHDMSIQRIDENIHNMFMFEMIHRGPKN